MIIIDTGSHSDIWHKWNEKNYLIETTLDSSPNPCCQVYETMRWKEDQDDP